MADSISDLRAVLEHSDLSDPSAVVRAFHAAMQDRNWVGGAQYLASDVTVWWPATDERFSGDRFLAMQQAYPEGWHIKVVELINEGTRLGGRIAVDHDGHRYWNHGCWTVEDGTITSAVELWGMEGSDVAPAWRNSYSDA